MPQGVARQQLELLGPILAHVIRPLVWVRGLWSIELEKVVFVFVYTFSFITRYKIISYILILRHFKFEVNIEHLICTGLDSLIWHRGMPDEAWLPPGSWGVLSFFCFSFFLFRPRQRIVSLNLSSLFLWPRKFLRRMKISPILLRQWSWKTPGQWSHVRCWLEYLWTAHFQLFQP